MTLASIGHFLRRRWLLVVTASVLLAFGALHLVWYIHPSSDVKTTADLETRLTDGQPTVVEFYSNL